MYFQKLCPFGTTAQRLCGLFKPRGCCFNTTYPRCYSLQSVGRVNEASAISTACPPYVESPSGCGYDSPFLGATDSAKTDWLFQPAGGGKYRFYIRSYVRISLHACQCIAGALACHITIALEDSCARCRCWQGPIERACRKVDRPALLGAMQTRVESGCSRNYLGMYTTDCSQITTDMFDLKNTSASLVCECKGSLQRVRRPA